MESEKKEWINYLRVIATVSVIFLHVSAEIPTLYKKIPDDIWWIGNFFDSAVRFCVPLFLMISGALLLGKKINTTDFLKKRIWRVLLPFLFWSLIYIALNVVFKLYTGEKINVLEYVFNQLHYGSANHLWFVYMILGVYLFVPIINSWIVNSETNDLLYYLLIWVLTLIIALPFKTVLGFNIDLYYFSGYLGYLILGYYLSKYDFNQFRFINISIFILFIIGFLITFFGTYLLTKEISVFNGSFYEYLTPNVLFMSIAVFVFGKNLIIKNVLLLKIIYLINKYSYGIFLIHILILILLRKINIYWNLLHPCFSIPLIVMICLPISLIIIYLINKLPYGKYISG